jgi:hypothetical protein
MNLTPNQQRIQSVINSGATAREKERQLEAAIKQHRDRGDHAVAEDLLREFASAIGRVRSAAHAEQVAFLQSVPGGEVAAMAKAARDRQVEERKALGPNPPPADTIPGAPDHLAIWRDMQARNPMAAAQYFQANQGAIVAARQRLGQ